MPDQKDKNDFPKLFRNAAPYINAFRGSTFVVMFNGETVLSSQFGRLIHDIALLNSLGIKLVLVHGARPQIEQRLNQVGADAQYFKDLRITDDVAMQCVKDAVGTVRLEIEAKLSMGLANSPMAGARLRIASGNFVVAKPMGIRDGVDYKHTGVIRRVDHTAIKRMLDDGAIVLLSPIGYSPTGEVFNVIAEQVATAVASALPSDKLIFLTEGELSPSVDEDPISEVSIEQAKELLNRADTNLNEDIYNILQSAIEVCRFGVKRVHIINNAIDGALLQELFTRDGVGTLISADQYENTRQALIDDVPGILELISPLENQGLLVKRSRELLEMEIANFYVMERDGMIIACAAKYTYEDNNVAELACLAVHPDYQKQGRGDALLAYIESLCKQSATKRLFVLSTQTMHWFIERGFNAADIESLPMQKRQMYNYQRKSKVFIKDL